MQKTFIGKIISLKMQNTAIVEILRDYTHPIYRKILKRSSTHKVDTNKLTLSVGDKVKIAETKPISSGKHFKVLEVLKI